MPQLDPTWFASQLFWLFICFTILHLVLSKVVLPPLQKVIASRKGAIESDLDVAQDLKSKAEQAKASYEATLIDSREKAQTLINEAEVASKNKTEEAIKALDAQVATQASNASSSIADKKQELLNKLMPATYEFTALIVEKLTRQTPTVEQVKKATDVTI